MKKKNLSKEDKYLVEKKFDKKVSATQLVFVEH